MRETKGKEGKREKRGEGSGGGNWFKLSGIILDRKRISTKEVVLNGQRISTNEGKYY